MLVFTIKMLNNQYDEYIMISQKDQLLLDYRSSVNRRMGNSPILRYTVAISFVTEQSLVIYINSGGIKQHLSLYIPLHFYYYCL